MPLRDDVAVLRPAEPLTSKSGGLALLLLFGGTLFLSALLLFSVQPLFARMVLPRLGGTPAVWSVALVFFQAVLLAGYAYAHLLVRRAGPVFSLVVHATLLCAALLWLPVAVAAGFESPPAEGQTIWLLALFAVSIGMPFFAVSASAPLLQAWFARTGHRHAADPYFLYGASNLGSIFALLSYPLLAEPLLLLRDQAVLWTILYVALALTMLACGSAAIYAGGRALHHGHRPDVSPPVSCTDRLRWMALAFVPSALLVAITAHISTNIAAAPLLWVLPLAVFLLTFVLAFQRTALIPRRWVEIMVPVAAVAAILTYGFPMVLGGLPGIAINVFALLIIALAWHSELVARRPDASRLTDFYLSMALGGVLGGACTSLAAPLLFDSVLEYPLLLALSLLVVPEALRLLARRVAIPLGLALVMAGFAAHSLSGVEYRDRSFFGVVSTRIEEGAYRLLVHGTTVHGAERLAGASRSVRPEPLTYYAEGGPLATAIALEQGRHERPLEVGVVGLGIGSLACYRKPDEAWRFYEIDPAVIAAAGNPHLFTFISSCAAEAPIVQGDARLALAADADRRFDVLVVDAFSSDSIPVHLLTRDALELYADRLRPGGVVLMHISNGFMELASVVAAGARDEGLDGARLLHRRPEAEEADRKFSSDVVVLASDPARIRAYRDAGWEPLHARDDVAAWTDDYSNVVGAILRAQGLL
jgi:hypothetical protein